MPVFAVDSEAVASATGTLRGIADRVRADVSLLVSTAVGLEGTWTGAAAARYQDSVGRWQGLQRNVEFELDGLNSALDAAGQSYADAEQSVSAMFR